MVKFLCPVCNLELNQEKNSLLCENRHCYDISRKGYVNLLLNNSSGRHGDDRLMINSRVKFLNKGYYDPLSSVLSRIVCSCTNDNSCIVDAGCGDGKYTADLLEALGDKKVDFIGFDISKYALEAVRHRSKNIRAAVASTSSMPLPDQCANIVLNIFSPLFPSEFYRILASDGRLIRVIPLQNHLIELKETIYDTPYRNDVPSLELPNFEIEHYETVCYKAELSSNEDICNLFMMTPYYYKTGVSDQDKLKKIDFLSISFEFGIISYKKRRCT